MVKPQKATTLGSIYSLVKIWGSKQQGSKAINSAKLVKNAYVAPITFLHIHLQRALLCKKANQAGLDRLMTFENHFKSYYLLYLKGGFSGKENIITTFT